MIRIQIADDHAIVRQGLIQILALLPEVTIVGEVSHGEALLDSLRQTPCDLVLLDMSMPGLSGVDLIERIHAAHPGLPILVLSMHIEAQIASRALKAGAAGYLTKDSESAILIEAIRKVAAGGNFIDPVLVESFVFSPESIEAPLHESLSEREFQVFSMLAAGKTVSEIADELFLSVKTVSTHKSRMMEKMGLHTQTDLIRYAIRQHLIEG